MASRKVANRLSRQRVQRSNSNVFAKLDNSQIMEFKEAFNMIDHNRDGFIDKDDLQDIFHSLGRDPTPEFLDDMMNDAHGPINFTRFLSLFVEKMQSTDPEEVIKNAFGCFDEKNVGHINEAYLKEVLTSMGDRLTEEEVDQIFKEAPIEDGMFNYVQFTRIIKNGTEDNDKHGSKNRT